MKKYPSVICGQEEHGQMQAIGIVATLAFPGAFLAVVLSATRRYSARFAASDHAFLTLYNFLFMRVPSRPGGRDAIVGLARLTVSEGWYVVD